MGTLRRALTGTLAAGALVVPVVAVPTVLGGGTAVAGEAPEPPARPTDRPTARPTERPTTASPSPTETEDTEPPPAPVLGEATVEPGGEVTLPVTAEEDAEIVVVDSDDPDTVVADATATGQEQELTWTAESGEYTYSVTATDEEDNESEPATFDLEVDADPPVLRAFEVDPGTPRDPTSVVSFITEPATSYSLLVDGKQVASGTTKGSGRRVAVEQTLDLADGRYPVAVELEDEAGNTTEDELRLVVDIPGLFVAARLTSEPTDTEQVVAIRATPGTRGTVEVPPAETAESAEPTDSADPGGSESPEETPGAAAGPTPEVVVVPAGETSDSPTESLSASSSADTEPADPAEPLVTRFRVPDSGRTVVTLPLGDGDYSDVTVTVVDSQEREGTTTLPDFSVDTTPTRLEAEVDLSQAAQGKLRVDVVAEQNSLVQLRVLDENGEVAAVDTLRATGGTDTFERDLEQGAYTVELTTTDAYDRVTEQTLEVDVADDPTSWTTWLLAALAALIVLGALAVLLLRMWKRSKERRAARVDTSPAPGTAESAAAYEAAEAAWIARDHDLARLTAVAQGQAPDDVTLPPGFELAPGEVALWSTPASLLEVDDPAGRSARPTGEAGRLVVTDQRYAFVGDRSRDWAHNVVEQVRHLGTERSILRIGSTWAGFSYPEQPITQSYVDMAFSKARGVSYAAVAERGQREHAMRRPAPPE